MNNPRKDKNAGNFAKAIITTDSDDSRIKIKEFFDDLRNPMISDEIKIEEANEVVDRLNRASKNLIPAHSSSNRSVGKHKDPQCVRKSGQFVETPKSTKIGNAFDKVRGTPYTAKSRQNSNGEIEYQSSSVHKESSNSGFLATSRKKNLRVLLCF